MQRIESRLPQEQTEASRRRWRSPFPEQVLFPMAGARDGWGRLARNLKAEIDTDLIEAYRGTESLPFEAGEHGWATVKIVDDRGIESLKVVELA